jgi:sulfite oxidase
VQAAPTENYFQSRAYRWFPPAVRAHNAVWEDGIPLGELPINAVICSPAEGETLPAGVVTLRGFALAQGDALIERVEVSLDGGTSWQTACLIGTPQRWAWCFWAFAATLAPGEHAVVVRAFDSAGHAQPADLSAVWNFKGYVNNAYHCVHFRVQDEA